VYEGDEHEENAVDAEGNPMPGYLWKENN